MSSHGNSRASRPARGRAAIESDPRGLYALGNHMGKIPLMHGPGAPTSEFAAAQVLMAAASFQGEGKQNALR